MSKCKICKVEILDKTDKCPLCNHVLEWDIADKEKEDLDEQLIKSEKEFEQEEAERLNPFKDAKDFSKIFVPNPLISTIFCNL